MNDFNYGVYEGDKGTGPMTSVAGFRPQILMGCPLIEFIHGVHIGGRSAKHNLQEMDVKFYMKILQELSKSGTWDFNTTHMHISCLSASNEFSINNILK